MEFDPFPDPLTYLPWLAAMVVTGLIARAVRRGAARPRRRAYLCSGCLQSFPAASTHLIPSFSTQLDNYVTTFRCENCWLRSLDETQYQLRAETADEAHRRKLVAFFERYGIRGLSAENVLGLLAILDDLRARRRVLPLPD